MTIEQTLRNALNRAWLLGQSYWRQADSDSFSQHRKSDETLATFQKLVDETVAQMAADKCLHDETQRLGAIWTECTQCGKRWADDEKPPQMAAPVAAAPDMVLVPREPTPEMIRAWRSRAVNASFNDEAWKAALAAAPAAQEAPVAAAVAAAVPERPMTLGEQVRDAQRVVSGWSSQKRDSVQLEGEGIQRNRHAQEAKPHHRTKATHPCNSPLCEFPTCECATKGL